MATVGAQGVDQIMNIPDLIGGIILGVVGLAMGAWAGSDALDGLHSASFRETTGVVEESHGTDAKKPAIDYLHLSYAYTVEGTRYVGHRVRFGHEGKDGTALARVYPVGRTVPVHYDPGAPANAVLVRGTDPFTPTLKALVALALIAAAVFKWKQAVAPEQA